jgi:hypothetical protein
VIAIDFRKHYHLGWTHYRTLMGLSDARKRVFYFERAAAERWSTRELDRRIAGALFERVALSRDTGIACGFAEEDGCTGDSPV